METTITVADLERGLTDVLDRVRERGERFVVERDGQRVATIGPVRTKAGVTGRELIERIGHLKMPGDGFADDLEAI